MPRHRLTLAARHGVERGSRGGPGRIPEESRSALDALGGPCHRTNAMSCTNAGRANPRRTSACRCCLYACTRPRWAYESATWYTEAARQRAVGADAGPRCTGRPDRRSGCSRGKRCQRLVLLGAALQGHLGRARLAPPCPAAEASEGDAYRRRLKRLSPPPEGEGLRPVSNRSVWRQIRFEV